MTGESELKDDRAIVFDMDGVIVDNRDFHFRAWRTFASRHGLEFDEESFKNKLFGRTNKEILRGLFGHGIPEKEALAMAEEKEALYRELYSDRVRPAAGLREFLIKLSNSDVPVAVCTAAPRINLEFVLDQADLRRFFDILIDESMVSKGKPAPDLYLKAAEMLQVEARRCLAFEDSLPGIASARAAGMKVIGLTTTHPPQELAGVELVIPDFRDIEPGMVMALIG